MHHTSGTRAGTVSLDQHGITPTQNVNWNLSTATLIEEAVQRDEGSPSVGGALVVETGEHTGRSAQDKYIVRRDSKGAVTSGGWPSRKYSGT